MKCYQIPPKSAVSVEIPNDCQFRVINSEGGRVVDTWAFNADDLSECLSMEHSRGALYKLLFKSGDTLVSNHYRPMLTIVDDTSPGLHDTLHAACSATSYHFFGAEAGHPNCQDNLKAELQNRGAIFDTIPCPWNLFEHTLVDEQLKLTDQSSAARPGDYLELRARMDLIVVCSACPSRVGMISGDEPRGAEILLL